MYSDHFDYFRPRTVAEASALLKKHKGSRVLAGGHSLLPAMKFRLANPKALVDIGGIKGLCGVQTRGKAIWIGATTTHAEIASSPILRKTCPMLAEAAAQIGDIQVRNRGTIGGSVAHADPAADFPTALVALGATIVAKGPKGERKIAADKFFVDLFTTALKAGEIVIAVLVPPYARGTGASYFKHPAPGFPLRGGRRRRRRRDRQGRDAARARASSSAGPRPTPSPSRRRAPRSSAASPTPRRSRKAAAEVAAAIPDPMGDTYASGEFRVHLATVLAKRALTAAVEHARA